MRRKKNAHKNDFGHVLVLAGSPSMLGAAALTGLAAMRTGAGLTTIAVAKSLNLTLQKKISNVIMTLPLPETRQGTISLKAFDLLNKYWRRYSAIAIGPGMTTVPGTVRFVEMMYRTCPLPLVVDADALNSLAGKLDRLKPLSGARILTPHPGEMSRLNGLAKSQIDKDRSKIALHYAQCWKSVVVLKGHRTVVASPEGKVYVNNTGNPGMATAGSGDVLTGMITALLAQGVAPFDAARFSVWLHGQAGDAACMKRGIYSVISTDLIEEISLIRKRTR